MHYRCNRSLIIHSVVHIEHIHVILQLPLLDYIFSLSGGSAMLNMAMVMNGSLRGQTVCLLIQICSHYISMLDEWW
jgi:hypothetical protein